MREFKQSRIRSAVLGNSRQFFIMRKNDRADLDDMGKDIALPEVAQNAIMNYPLPKLLLFTLVAGLFAGCASTRPISDMALSAGGAYLVHELSNGDPLATAAGAAGGGIVIETLHYSALKQAEKAYATGYKKGKSNAVKQQYWLYVSMQKQRNQIGSVRRYPIQLAEQRIDGVTFQPSTKLLRYRGVKSKEQRNAPSRSSVCPSSR